MFFTVQFFFSAFQLALHKITIFWEISIDEFLMLMPQMGTVLEACSLTSEISPGFSCNLQPICEDHISHSSYISDVIVHVKEFRMGSDRAVISFL